MFHLISKYVADVWCVYFYRLMSQLHDVNTQSSVGMFRFYDVILDS